MLGMIITVGVSYLIGVTVGYKIAVPREEPPASGKELVEAHKDGKAQGYKLGYEEGRYDRIV